MPANSIQWSVGLDTVNFSKALNGIGKAVEGQTKTMRNMLLGVAGVFGVGFGVKEIGGLIGRSLELGKNLESLSRESGFTAGQINLMTHALDRSGMSAEGATAIMSGLREKLFQAQEHLGGTQQAFQALGLSMEEMRGMAPEKQFETLAIAINSVKNPLMRTQAATAMLGAEGAKAIANFQVGDIEKSAKLFGKSIRGMDAGAANLARAHDAMKRITSTGQEFFNAMVAKLAPTFEAVATKLEDLIPSFLEAAEKFGNKIQGAFEVLIGLIKTGQITEALKLSFEIAVRYMADKLVQTFSFMFKFLQTGFMKAIHNLVSFLEGALLKALVTAMKPLTWLPKWLGGNEWKQFSEIENKKAEGKFKPEVITGGDIAKMWDDAAMGIFSDPALGDRLGKLFKDSAKTGAKVIETVTKAAKANRPGEIPGKGLFYGPIITAFDSFRKVGANIGAGVMDMPRRQLDKLTEISSTLKEMHRRGSGGPLSSGATGGLILVGA
jgi:hypothetical protein